MIIVFMFLFFMYRLFIKGLFSIKYGWFYLIINKVTINFYEIGFFRLLFIFFIDGIIRNIIRFISVLLISNSHKYILIVILIFFTLFLFLFVFLTINHIQNVLLLSNFAYLDKSMFCFFPYEKHFSLKFDLSMVMLKIIISINLFFSLAILVEESLTFLME